MNLVRLSMSNLRFRALASSFNLFLLSLGIALIVALLHVEAAIGDRFTRDLEGIDLVVGAKGSPLQLILSSVFHLDIPNGNIPLSDAEKLEANPLVQSAIPMALGDNLRGFRIVGTTPDYAYHYRAVLADGRYWTADMEAVLGSDAAAATGLKPGAHFVGAHGLTAGGEEHSAFPYTVTGVLRPTGTVIDRLVLTGLGSVWNVHEHHHDDDEEEKDTPPADAAAREVTSVLIHYKSPFAAVTLPRLLNQSPRMQAASPALETARLFSLLGTGSALVTAFGGLLLIIAGLGFFVTLYAAVEERRYDIALLRALGATRGHVLRLVLFEGLLLGSGGVALGLALGHAGIWALDRYAEGTRHLHLSDSGLTPEEGVLALIALGIGLIASILPAMMATRVDIAKILARGS